MQCTYYCISFMLTLGTIPIRDFAGLLFTNNPETWLIRMYFVVSRGDIFQRRGNPTYE